MRRSSIFTAAAAVVFAAAGVTLAGPASATEPGVTGYTISAGRPTAIPANSAGVSQVADAFCPNGKVVLSGGVTNHSSTVFIRTSYPTDSKTWQVVVTPSQNIGYAETFTPYAVCGDASSLPGYHQVQTSNLAVGPNTYYGPNKAVGDAYCAAGEYVTGGGVKSHNPSTWMTVSRPTSDQRAWEVEVNLTNPPSYGGEYYQVSAICVPRTDLSQYSIVNATTATYGTGLTQAAPANAAGSPYCPADTLAVAAGATNHDQNNGFISSVTPTSSGKYWVISDRDLNPPSYGEHFLPVGVCVSATT